jgi:hypothetical protein
LHKHNLPKENSRKGKEGWSDNCKILQIIKNLKRHSFLN